MQHSRYYGFGAMTDEQLILLMLLVLSIEFSTISAQPNITVGATECYACGAGSFSALDGSAQCQFCEAGYYASTSSSTGCQECPAGTYSLAGASGCTPCPMGTWSDTLGAGSPGTCRDCPAGSYRNATGGTSPGPESCFSCPQVPPPCFHPV